MNRLPVYFTAGCIGGLAYCLAAWLSGRYGLSQALGVALAPALSLSWLYPRIVWGGLWGLAFFLPVLRSHVILRGLVLSLLPALVHLFVIFPFQTRHGFAGLGLGMLTPLLIVLLYAVWGLVTAIASKLLR